MEGGADSGRRVGVECWWECEREGWLSVLWEGGDRQEHGEGPPPVLQGVGSKGGGTTVRGVRQKGRKGFLN